MSADILPFPDPPPCVACGKAAGAGSSEWRGWNDLSRTVRLCAECSRKSDDAPNPDLCVLTKKEERQFEASQRIMDAVYEALGKPVSVVCCG